MAIGQHVFVDSAGNHSGSVTLADVSGKIPSTTHLEDGIEVEVVAWRPRGTNETRYRVRAPDGIDGWLPAENLRPALVPVAPLEASTPTRGAIGADTGGRRFGQRSHAEHFASAPPPPAQPPLSLDTGRRRFGQH